MDSQAAKQSKPPKDEASSTEGRCCQEESGENRAPEPPERSRLFVQYEEGNPSVYADFGATLLTDNQSHRLVDVSPMGIAHRIGLLHNDEIFFFNGVDVGDVIHGSLVDAIRDAGPRLLFGGIRITNQEQSSLVEKGYVYVRLGAEANNVPQIKFHKLELTEVEHEGAYVDLLVLPDGESFPEYTTKYKLTGSTKIELSSASGMNLAIRSNGAYFIRRNFTLCMYTYLPSIPDSTATIVAIATAITDPSSSSQYCISGSTVGPINTESFPDYMKTIYRPPKFLLPQQTKGKLFRWVLDRRMQQTITPLANRDLMLDSGVSPYHNQAVLEEQTSYVTINDLHDCTRNCTISQSTAAVECSDD